MTQTDAMEPARLAESISAFDAKLRETRVYATEDPIDVSLLPQMLSQEEHARTSHVCKSVIEAAFAVLADYLSDRARPPKLPFNDQLLSLPRPKRDLIGNVRMDFLPHDGKLSLIELNFVNVSGIEYATQAASSLQEVVREYARCDVLRPVHAMKRRLLEDDVSSLLILTKDNPNPNSKNDWEMIAERLAPEIHATAIPRARYHDLRFKDRLPYLDGVAYDAVYLRTLDGPETIGQDLLFCKRLLSSNAIIYDNPQTMLLEDKDLRVISERNPELREYLPKIYDPQAVPAVIDIKDLVLKVRDAHSGKGVFFNPEHVNIPGAILQEKILADSRYVVTVQGNKGHATADLAVHCSYRYDLHRRMLKRFEIGGYFSRFSLTGPVVNLCQGGGIIPVLMQRDGGVQQDDEKLTETYQGS